MRWTILFTAAFACGCAGTGTSDVDDTEPGPGAADVDRGPTEIPLDADANGLWWDAASSTLYIADDNANRILKWTDAGGLEEVGVLPGEPSGLGQVVSTPDGKLVSPSFGFGAIGGVLWISQDGSESGSTPGLDSERRRIGLAIDADGQLYDGWFLSLDSGRIGAVSKVSLDGGEVDVIPDLGKPIGVVVVGDTMYVSDQDRDEVLSKKLPDGPLETFAVLTDPDLLAAGPDGSLFTGSVDGNVYQIAADGTVSAVVTSTPETRGVAWDDANRRLFFAEHDPDESDGLEHALHIAPVDE